MNNISERIVYLSMKNDSYSSVTHDHAIESILLFAVKWSTDLIYLARCTAFQMDQTCEQSCWIDADFLDHNSFSCFPNC